MNMHFLLDKLCQVNGIAHALVVSGDGLPIAATPGLQDVDQLAAISSGLGSLTTGAATFMQAGAVEQTVVEMTEGFLVTMTIDDRSILTVLADKKCDLGQISYEMALTIGQVGDILTPDPRQSALA